MQWSLEPGPSTTAWEDPPLSQGYHDQFAKAVHFQALCPFAGVQLDQSIPGEPLRADLVIRPNNRAPERPEMLGVIPRLADADAIFEPYSRPLRDEDLVSCMGKLCWALMEGKRKGRAKASPLYGFDGRIWLLTPGCARARLSRFGLQDASGDGWPRGFYFLPSGWRFGVILIHELPETPDTVLLRLNGTGEVQKRAIREVLALVERHPVYMEIVEVFRTWGQLLQEHTLLTRIDRELAMALQESAAEWMKRVRSETRLESLRALLNARFGHVDEALEHVAGALARLPADEAMTTALNSSREELLRRFGPRQ